jgi:hypothetical protein
MQALKSKNAAKKNSSAAANRYHWRKADDRQNRNLFTDCCDPIAAI